MQVFKHFLVWAGPSHGFGKEMQEKALPGPGQIMALVRKSKRKLYQIMTLIRKSRREIARS